MKPTFKQGQTIYYLNWTQLARRMICVAYNLEMGIDPEAWTYREALKRYNREPLLPIPGEAYDQKYLDSLNKVLWDSGRVLPGIYDPKFFDTMNRILWEMDVTWGTCIKREYNKYSEDKAKYRVQGVGRFGIFSLETVYIGDHHLYTTSRSRVERYIRNSCCPSEASRVMSEIREFDLKLDQMERFWPDSEDYPEDTTIVNPTFTLHVLKGRHHGELTGIQFNPNFEIGE